MARKLKVEHLRKMLKDIDGERDVYLSSDPEGNQYCLLDDEIEMRILDGAKSLVLFPTNGIINHPWEDDPPLLQGS